MSKKLERVRNWMLLTAAEAWANLADAANRQAGACLMKIKYQNGKK